MRPFRSILGGSNRAGRWRPSLLLALLCLAIVGIAGVAFHSVSGTLKSQLNDELDAVAEFKARQLEAWLEERRQRAADLARMPFFVATARQRRQAPDAAGERRLVQRLAMLRTSRDFHAAGVTVFSAAGKRLLSSGLAGPGGGDLAAALRQAAGQAGGVFVDLQEQKPEGTVLMGFVAAIRDGDVPESELLGFLFCIMDPAEELFPLVQSWPRRSASAETLIVRRDGGEIVFLNALRHSPAKPLSLRVSLSRAELPSAQAISRGPGLHEGRDYRGVQVIAASRRVAGTPWFLVAKIDRDEVYGNIERLFAASVVLSLGAILVVGALLRMNWRQQRLKEILAERMQLQAIAASVPGVIYSFRQRPDGSAGLPFASQAFEEVMGLRREGLAEDAGPIFSMVHPEDIERFLHSIAESARSLSAWHEEWRSRHPAKGEIWLEAHSMPTREADGSTLWHGFVQDVTQRKRYEIALAESEERLRRSQAYGGIGTWEADLLHDRQIWSEAVTRVLGFPGLENPTWEDFLSVVHPDDRRVLAEATQAHLERGAPYDVEYRILASDGRQRWMRSAGSAEFDGDGNPVRMCGIVQDVTQRKNAELATRRHEATLHAIIDTALDAVVQMDSGGFITGWNDHAETIFGWTRGEIVGRQLHETIIPPAYRQAHLQGVQTFLATGVGPILNTRIEVAALHRQGHEFFVELSVTAMGDAGAPVFCAFIRDISERKRAEALLRQSDLRFRTLFESSPDPVWIIEGNRFVQCNQAAVAMLGFPGKDAVLNSHPAQLSPAKQADGEDSYRKAERMMAVAMEQGINRFEWIHTRCDGSTFPAEVTLSAFSLEDRPALYCTWRDISERKRAEESMRLASLVYQHSSEAMVVTDAEGAILSVNPAFTEVTGYAPEEAIGRNPKMLSSGRHDAAFYQAMWRAIVETGQWQGEIWNRRKNGEVYAEWLTINTIFGEGGQVHRRVALFKDISDKKATDELIWKQANFDFLTGLPNRRMFQDRLSQFMKQADRDGLSLALLFLDLDHFKEVNDTLGHAVGDELLKEVARRLVCDVRASDTVARLGGDEFTVILGGCEDVPSIDSVAQQILDALAEPFQLGHDLVYISASVGVTLYPDDAADVDALLKNADQAMYAAKEDGRNRYRYFTRFMQEAAQIRGQLAADLRSALAGGQFQLHYQPIVDLRTGHVAKAEALIRWRNPRCGLVSPAAFIPIAEETGLIVEIGDWVFREAARQAVKWRDSHHPAFQISVNKSPAQFRCDRDHHSGWLEHLQALKLPGESIVVEITEGLLMEGSREKLLAFRDAGLQVAIDDFGTGYSSLSYLKKFDIDYLKIDQSFTRNLAPDSEDMTLCVAIIVMAHSLGLMVIAEGVETEEQRRLLAAAGCDYGQGYLFSKPLPADDFDALLSAWGNGGYVPGGNT